MPQAARTRKKPRARFKGVIRIEIMRIIWNIHTQTKSKEKAERILFKVAEALNVETGPIFVEKKGDGGCLCVFSHNLNSENLEECVYESFVMAQRIGYSWSLNGNIEEEIDLWSEKLQLPGIKAINAACNRNV